VTLSSPGGDGGFKRDVPRVGDHAENSFSVDGQPITDQQSKAFSNQLPDTAVQSMQVIEGAPPAEYGDKTSLVIQVTTRSGQGDTKPTGQVNFSYGDVWVDGGRVGSGIWRGEVGELHLGRMGRTRGGFWMRRSSWSFTTKGTRRTSSIASIIRSTRRIL